MGFYDMVEEVLALLQRHKRVTYRALQRQFNLDEAYLEDLKAEIIKARQLAVDEGGREQTREIADMVRHVLRYGQKGSQNELKGNEPVHVEDADVCEVLGHGWTSCFTRP